MPRAVSTILAACLLVWVSGSSVCVAHAQTGTESLLYTLCDQASCPGLPFGPGVLASDGNYYGVVEEPAYQSGNSAIYRLTPGGVFTLMHSFCPTSSNCTGGADVESGLIQGMDGSF